METQNQEQTLRISQLLVDVQNPRLPSVKESQQEAIRSMVHVQGDKIIALAKHLVENGPNPSSLPIVMPNNNSEGMFDVLDGNRRVTALKLLESPSIVEDILAGKAYQSLKQLCKSFEQNPINQLNCFIVASRDDADTWIQLIHRGQNEGAGLVEWDGQVAARYDARVGSKPFALHVLDFVKDNAELSEETQRRIDEGKFPITNLERLVNTPYVREKLGIEKVDGEALTTYPEQEVLKGLTQIVEDIGTKKITVSDIKSQTQRIDYINAFNETDLPAPSSKAEESRSLGEESEGGDESKTTDAAELGTSLTRPRAQSANRRYLIPSSCVLRIDQPRINRVYRELKQLNVHKFPNAVGVMLRVFIELSLDYYLENMLNWNEQRIDNAKLANKLDAARDYMQTSNIMTRQQLDPIKKAASGQTILVASVKTLHSYVHNQHFNPIPSELNIAWDDLQPFIENIWPR